MKRSSALGSRTLGRLLPVLLACAATAAGSPQAAGYGLLVSLSGEDRVALIEPETGRTVTTFPMRSAPHEIAVSPDGGTAYVANSGGGPGGPAGHHVAAIDLRARTVRHIDVSPHETPHDIRVSRDGRLIWVAVAPSRAVLELDARNGRVVRKFDVGAEGGWFVAASPDGRKLYIPLLEGKGLVSIDRPRPVARRILSGGAFSGAEVSPDGREVWALEHEARTLHVVSSDTDRPIARISLEAAEFGRLQFTPDGRQVIVVQGTDLLAFDTATRRRSARLTLPHPGKVVAIDPSGGRAVVSHPADDKVTIVDLTAMRPGPSFSTGKAPDGVAWIPAR